MKASELRAKSRRHMIRAERAARFSARADARWAAARDARLAAEHQNAGAIRKAATTASAEAAVHGRGGGVRDKWQQENGREKRRPGRTGRAQGGGVRDRRGG